MVELKRMAAYLTNNPSKNPFEPHATWLKRCFDKPAEELWQEVLAEGGDANATIDGDPILYFLGRDAPVATVRFFLEMGADPNSVRPTDPGERSSAGTVLGYVLDSGDRRPEVIALLLEFGADPLFQPPQLSAPPMVLALPPKGSPEIRRLLRAAAGDRPYQKKGASFECKSGKKLLDLSGKDGLGPHRSRSDGEDRWHYVALEGDFEENVRRVAELESAHTGWKYIAEFGAEERRIRSRDFSLVSYKLKGSRWTIVELNYSAGFPYEELSKQIGENLVVSIFSQDFEVWKNGKKVEEVWCSGESADVEGMYPAQHPNGEGLSYAEMERYERAHWDKVNAEADAWLAARQIVLVPFTDCTDGFTDRVRFHRIQRQNLERVAFLSGEMAE